MPKRMQSLIDQYVEEIKRIYGSHVKQIILYGSYARGDFRPDSDVDIMILVDMSDLELKAYGQQLSLIHIFWTAPQSSHTLTFAP